MTDREARVPVAIERFLGAPTPAKWIEAARDRLPVLLNDHANCEKKAAASALALMFRYPEDAGFVAQMSRLAREELRHFEQVSDLMQRLGVDHCRIKPSSYARKLHEACRSREPGRFVDALIVAAIIEARSCERFARLVPVLPPEVGRFYARLLSSEARHFVCYLDFARAAGGDIDARIDELLALEASLITAADDTFAFHSGVPAAGATSNDVMP